MNYILKWSKCLVLEAIDSVSVIPAVQFNTIMLRNYKMLLNFDITSIRGKKIDNGGEKEKKICVT